MTMGATVDNFSTPTGASILHFNSVQIRCRVNHGLPNDMHYISYPLETTYLYFMKESTEIHAPTTGVYP